MAATISTPTRSRSNQTVMNQTLISADDPPFDLHQPRRSCIVSPSPRSTKPPRLPSPNTQATLQLYLPRNSSRARAAGDAGAGAPQPRPTLEVASRKMKMVQTGPTGDSAAYLISHLSAANLSFVRSSFCESAQCMEHAYDNEGNSYLRDSKDAGGPVIKVNAYQWMVFIDAIRRDGFIR